MFPYRQSTVGYYLAWEVAIWQNHGFNLKELEENYTFFEEAYEEYMSECEHGKAFPIEGLGDGSIVFIDLESGKVRGYNNDYDDIEEIAESFSKLILDLVEQVESFS